MGARLKRQRETIALLTLKKKAKEEGERGSGKGQNRQLVSPTCSYLFKCIADNSQLSPSASMKRQQFSN